jgi:hypothetical protein
VTVTIGQARHDLGKRARTATRALIAASCVAAVALATALSSAFPPALLAADFSSALWLAFAVAAAIALLLAIATSLTRKDLARFSQAEREIRSALSVSSSALVYEHLGEIEHLARRTPAVSVAKEHFSGQLDLHLERILQREARERRQARVEALCRAARSTLATKLAEERANSPIMLAERRLVDAVANLKLQKAAAEKELDRQREEKWLKLWFDMTRPDFAEVDEKVEELEAALRRLRESGALEAEGRRYDALPARIDQRTSEIERAAIEAIPQDRSEDFDEDRILRNATWLAAFSVPVSAWNDFSKAGDVYDSLREVNGNYAGLSDFEIWLETLTMAPAELAGLGSLAKGAYFERLVESAFGGQRFEHFNHPDTDIVIDGTAYQVKATDSASYVESVPDDIPVISTTEVAEITGSIDAGYLNAELTETVDLSLGGTVIDIGDTTVDAVLTGVGGVGILAVLKGVWSGSAHYKKTGNALEALSVGLSTTAVSTARTVVNAAEIAGRGTIGLIRSRPVRFAGRMIVAGGRRMDDWLVETPEEGRRSR